LLTPKFGRTGFFFFFSPGFFSTSPFFFVTGTEETFPFSGGPIDLTSPPPGKVILQPELYILSFLPVFRFNDFWHEASYPDRPPCFSLPPPRVFPKLTTSTLTKTCGPPHKPPSPQFGLFFFPSLDLGIHSPKTVGLFVFEIPTLFFRLYGFFRLSTFFYIRSPCFIFFFSRVILR